jgi:hypothetical protein
MTEREKDLIIKERVGNYIDYQSPRIAIILGWLKPRKNQDTQIVIAGTLKSIRCKIIGIHFMEPIRGDYLLFGYRLVLEIQREDKNPFVFYSKFITVERLKLG